MSQKTAKKKSKKSSKGAEPSVLGNLRATRPTRIGGERRSGGPGARTATATKTPDAKPAAAKPAATKTSVKKAKPSAGKASKRKATAKPQAVRSAVKRSPKKAPAAATQPNAAAAQRPAPPPPPPRRSDGRPSGTEIVTTAVQAAGELAQIGITVGGQILKRAADRIPRP